METRHIFLTGAISLIAACSAPKDGTYSFSILTTNDVHGSWFDSPYNGKGRKTSLFAVRHYCDSIRKAEGQENVVLIDAGDCLQGDNAAYYFNYVDTLSPHLFPRLVSYMGYDAITVGNHDIETGHRVYDRVAAELAEKGIPFLGGNALRPDGSPYFPPYTILKRHGLRIAVLGFTNPNIKAWLSPSLWSGMSFKSLLPLVQEEVDRVMRKEKPHIVIVSVHSGTGDGNADALESQGLDLYKSLKGVDFLICSHDHRPIVLQNDSICLINAGSHARHIGHGRISLNISRGRVESKTVSAGLLAAKPEKADTAMRKAFSKDFEAVKEFTMREVGRLTADLRTRDSYAGMSDYTNLLHTVSLRCTPAVISFAAPLAYNGFIKSGTLRYNDLFRIYPYENQLFVVSMTGREIKDYLEHSYDGWINTVTEKELEAIARGRNCGKHLLKIRYGDDPRNNQKQWSFVKRFYNFDSAAGIEYTVDVTKPSGERISIASLADGAPFDEGAEYPVAMTSYRASGGGGHMGEGAGVDTDSIDSRILERYPEIRNLIYDYLNEKGEIDAAAISSREKIGHWEFIPRPLASQALEEDLRLLFPPRR